MQEIRCEECWENFLGINNVQDESSGDVWVGQPAYTDKVIRKYGMQDAKCVSTPVDPSNKLVKAEDGEESFDQSVYQSAVGSLLYLSTGTRPEVAFAVSYVAKFSSDPTKKHWMAVKRIFRYLKSTSMLGLLYTKSGENELVGFRTQIGPVILMTEGLHRIICSS